MSQFDGSETETKKTQNGRPTIGQTILCTLMVFGMTMMVAWMLFVRPPQIRGVLDGANEHGSHPMLPSYYGETRAVKAPTQRPLIESEKEMVSLGIGTIQEVAKAKCGLTVVGISFKNKEGVTFGAIAGEGEWNKGDMCKLVILKYSSHSAFPSSPEYVAVKVEVDGHP